ncbi:MAG: histidine kinase [Clostridiales bacterium]|nr:histidine kinase [Clostridiales bacterium]
MFRFVRVRNFFSQLKLNKKFLFMYIFAVILPLIITDAVLFRSVFEAELDNQRKYREDATNAYVNRIQDILDYDAQVAMAIDLNKDLNEFIDTEYDIPYGYFNSYIYTVSTSFFATLSNINQDRLVIYSDNNTMMSGHYFHNIKEIYKEKWYQEFNKTNAIEAAYAYYDNDPIDLTSDRNRFIYVRKMNNADSKLTKIITIEHKMPRIYDELGETPINCNMYLCCGDYVIYSSKGDGASYQEITDRASKVANVTVSEVKMYDNTFTLYAFTEEFTVLKVISEHILITFLIILLTLIIPILLMKLLERSITDRITILGKAFGEGGNEYFQPIKEISGSDEISELMHNYNRIVDINNKLTNTIYKDKLREQESDLARKNAELLALQSQINPHFLFNALESIRMHSILKGENETAEMVQRLAVMERQNVEWHDDAVTIQEEEEFIDAYLQLQSYRFGDRISFDIDISEECKKILIPKLTLVTFVENACIHGIESKATQGWIFVRVNKEGDNIVIEVEDTGDGMDEKDVIQLQRKMNDVTIAAVKKAKHVGILNACLRIKMMFKDQAKFTIESEKGIGMSVIITIPADMITIAE